MPETNEGQLPETGWYADWHAELLARGPAMNSRELEASANLATVLLCGEQSAIRIFAAEIQRSRASGGDNAISDLVLIERDEHLHEKALSAFRDFLPGTSSQHSLKRRAQRYFTSLGRARTVSAHFARIAELDSAVCQIMWHVEHSGLSKASPLRHLAGRIKLDEARHVAVSRHYADAIGYDKRAKREDAEFIRQGLTNMLQPLGDSFEAVGVDSDDLFRRLSKSRLP